MRIKLLSLGLLATTLVALAGLPPEQQPQPASQEPPAQPVVTNAVPAELAKMHAENLRRFAASPGFGLSRTPNLRQHTEFQLAGMNRYVPKPDLIALETKPVAYRSLGREALGMATLTNRIIRAQLHSRPITTDEARAIAELRSGKEFAQRPITAPAGSGKPPAEAATLVLGAMRANAACAKCHEVPEGTLLGAFSYTLYPNAASTNALVSLLGQGLQP